MTIQELLERLRTRKACAEGIAAVAACATPEEAWLAATQDDREWLIWRLPSLAPLDATYWAARDPLLEQYWADRVALWAKHEAARAKLWAKYEADRDALFLSIFPWSVVEAALVEL